jgi:CheY-like chemotaxis protein
VVLVDDDEDTRDLVEAILRNCGATVTVFDAPEPALAAVTQAWPDVVVSDIAMPDMDGYTFGRRVRSIQEAAGVKVSLLALTGDATVRGRREALAAGFDRHVAKPIDPAEFQWLVATLVGRAA